MHIPSALRAAAATLFLASLPFSSCFAVDTHVWEQSDQSDFTRGTAKHLSIRSDGHISLAPEFTELDSTTVPYLWTIAQDSKGTLFYAGGAPTGATAKVFSLKPGGKSKVLAELTGLEIHALAVDSQDRVYAAVLPDAKIYRIDRSGKAELFFDPKCKYVWAMAFDHSGNLFVATGDSGLIYKVAPDGKGSEFARTDEAHARSMIIDSAGNLIVGTEPAGLVLRIRPNGEKFVLFQTNKREVTAVAEHDGVIYASAVGNKPFTLSVSGAAPVLPSNTPSVSSTGATKVGATPPSLPPAVGSLSASVSGGSDVYRIQKDGFAERIWESPTDIVYAIGFDSAGKPLLGTGNKGIIYRIDSDQLSTQLLNAPPTQVTAFLQGREGVVYAVTGNVGNVYSIGARLEKAGTLESETLDSGEFSIWGKAHISANLHGGSAELEVRSGNLNDPQHDWSPWTAVPVTRLGGQIAAPPARFLQYRLTLQRAPDGGSPDLSVIDIPYLPKNIAPKVRQIEFAPFNYRQAPSNSALERTLVSSGAPSTLSVPAVGQKRTLAASSSSEAAGPATLQYNKGYLTVRWSASDANGDPLLFKVEVRSKNESLWRVLKDKLQDRFYAFDTAAFPDGEYVIRVTASDAPGNTESQALTSSLESDSFTIDNTAPEIKDVKVVPDGASRTITFTAADSLSWIDKAEMSVNGADWVLLNPVNKVTDSQVLTYRLKVEPGQMIAIRVFDENDNVAVKQLPL